MKADILTLRALFQKDVRYVIPTFQRPYVWNQEDQWEPLWNDVRNTSEDFLEQLDLVGGEDRPRAEEATRGHFLGAVVLQQQPTATADLETRQVIDGQQRLTTLQLLLDAAQEVFERDGFQKEARQLRKLVLNDDDYAVDSADKIFKIWPTLSDQDAFRATMRNNLSIDAFEETPIVQAHEFFKLQIRQWLEQLPEQTDQRAEALVTALLGLLRVVVIDLQSNDDPNTIFETLNARGTPLLASDLIKNSILHTAVGSGLNSDTFYKEYWMPFDREWWRREIRQGRIVRPRIDTFLGYWLTMRLANEVQSSDMFPQFQRYAGNPGRSITQVASDIRKISTSYRELEEIDMSTADGIFLYRWRVIDAGVSTPVILWLFSNRHHMTTGTLHGALHAIESYLIRRMMCRMTTKDYNRTFLPRSS